MKRLEVIELRSLNITQSELMTYIKKFLNDINSPEVEKIQIYYSLNLDTDFSIHIFFNSDENNVRENLLGVQLVNELKQFGLVFHGIWIELKH